MSSFFLCNCLVGDSEANAMANNVEAIGGDVMRHVCEKKANHII